MARVTVEDCIKKVPNRFELCLIAGSRAKNLLTGAKTEVEKKEEKVAVIALREIGGNMIDADTVRSNMIQDLKNKTATDYSEELSENNEEIEVVSEEEEEEASIQEEETEENEE